MIKDHNVVLEDYTLFHYTQYIIKQGTLCTTTTCNGLAVDILNVVSATLVFCVSAQFGNRKDEDSYSMITQQRRLNT